MIDIQPGLPETLPADRTTIIVTPQNILSNPIPIMVAVELKHAFVRAVITAALRDKGIAITTDPIPVSIKPVLEIRNTREASHKKGKN